MSNVEEWNRFAHSFFLNRQNTLIRCSMLDVRCSTFISFFFDQTGRSAARGGARIKLLKLYPHCLKLFSDQGVPTAICLWIGRTGMGYTPDGYGWIGYSDSGPVLCEFAHTDYITGLQVFYGATQRPVTGGQQHSPLTLVQLVGCPVAPGGFDEL